MAYTSAPNLDNAALVAAASNPLTGAKEASAFGGVEGLDTSAPNPGKAALVVAASNPLVDATEASAFGGVENAKSISAPIRPIGASVASTEGRHVENLNGEYASRKHESHRGKSM